MSVCRAVVRLRARPAPIERGTDAGPWLGPLRRHKAICSLCGGCVGDAVETDHAIARGSVDLSAVGFHIVHRSRRGDLNWPCSSRRSRRGCGSRSQRRCRRNCGASAQRQCAAQQGSASQMIVSLQSLRHLISSFRTCPKKGDFPGVFIGDAAQSPLRCRAETCASIRLALPLPRSPPAAHAQA